eukprot:CAMPEP_0204225620 /NCGR_PEP_ID=MMETSP0361-20130328/84343_1 /ASSEMBLY_ACC=CAM_ASM_000343 /TAXON_ID=268821 /ORGANISM="Scrippsiella Hangoei, Strain SHTV-5" /LENGTH=168 /DNA_ID=CAMNT_0051192191 /DNA_START=24 /DNA_END=531 /DNA_ORIENTATION=+
MRRARPTTRKSADAAATTALLLLLLLQLLLHLKSHFASQVGIWITTSHLGQSVGLRFDGSDAVDFSELLEELLLRRKLLSFPIWEGNCRHRDDDLEVEASAAHDALDILDVGQALICDSYFSSNSWAFVSAILPASSDHLQRHSRAITLNDTLPSSSMAGIFETMLCR